MSVAVWETRLALGFESNEEAARVKLFFWGERVGLFAGAVRLDDYCTWLQSRCTSHGEKVGRDDGAIWWVITRILYFTEE